MTRTDLGGDYAFFGICGHQKLCKKVVDRNQFHFDDDKTDDFDCYFTDYLLTQYILSSIPRIIKITHTNITFDHHQNGSECAGSFVTEILMVADSVTFKSYRAYMLSK